MGSPYDDIIDDLAKNDPEFLKQSPDIQDKIVQELAQERYGKIPNTGNFLENAIRGVKNRSINFAVAGLPSAVSPAENRPEDALPAIAQFGTDSLMDATPEGRIAGLIPGVKLAATVGATTGAEGLRQSTKALRGEKFDVGQIGKTAGMTAATEAIGRTGENLLFRTQIGKDVIGGAQKRLGGELKKLFDAARNNPSLQVAKADLVGYLEHAFEQVPFKIGAKAKGFGKVIDTVKDTFPEIIGPEEIAHTENMLGDLAEFSAEKSGKLKNKAANVQVKNARSYASGLQDHIATEAGMPGVVTASKEVSAAKKAYQPEKKGIADLIAQKVGGPGALGALVGAVTKNPVYGAVAGAADLALGSEGVRNNLYKYIVKSGASKTGRVGITEYLKKAK